MSKHLTFKTLAPARKSNLNLLSEDWMKGHTKAHNPDPNRRKRAVIYPRFSSSLQEETSIDRQVDGCTKYIDRIGAELVEVGDRFADREMSGAYMINRDGLNELLVNVAKDMYDIVVVEDADRLSRDIGHLGEIYRTCEHHGTELHAAMRGKLGLAEIAMYGFLSAEQRIQLKTRTRGGCVEAARQGRAPKGRIYGYASAPQRHGFLVINKEQAAIVLLIFTMYDEGVPIRAIVRYLNREGVKGPCGGAWNKAAIVGCASTGTGILRNNRYKGVLVYNRTETRLHPTTGKRTLVMRPEGDWVVVEVPEWQFVDGELWGRVQKRLNRSKTVAGKIADGETVAVEQASYVARASLKHEPMFPGQIHCTCGARMGISVKHAAQGKRLHCSSNLEQGGCKVGHSVGLAYVERNLLRMLRDGILCDQTVGAFEAEYLDATSRIQDEVEAKRKKLADEIAKLDASIERTWDPIEMAGFSNERITNWRVTWETTLSQKRDELRGLPKIGAVPQPDPSRAADLRGAITDLIDRIPSPLATEEDLRLAASVRGLVSRVELEFVPGGRGYALRVDGRLDGLLNAGQRDDGPVPMLHRLEASFGPTEWGRMSDPDKRRKMNALALSGEHGLREDDWSSIEHLFGSFDLRSVDARAVLDAGLFHLRTQVPFSKLPSCYGNVRTVRGALIRMVKVGVWERSLDILRTAGADVVRGLDASAFERWKQADR